MARNEGFIQYILEEVMREIPGISTKSMFGALSLYKDGVLFGMIIDDTLFFKVDETNKQDFIDRECKPFFYKTKTGKEVAMGYYTVPEEIMENKEKLAEWVDKAVQAKKNIKNKKK